MKKIVNLVFLLFTAAVLAQTTMSESQVKTSGEIVQEKVFIHANNSLLFAGEYIYYKLYALADASGNLSWLSKVAYVELVGEDGTRVFRHKLKLENGTGRGDFFIPTAVPSGNYKLLGYTQWMLNGGEENIFRSDVAILNPYRGDQSALTPTEDAGVQRSLRISAEGSRQTRNVSNDLRLDLVKQKYSHREQVLLKLSGNTSAANGNYSVSVRKAEEVQYPEMPSAANYSELYSDINRGRKTEVHLPELRGELLRGRIAPTPTSEGLSVQNKKVALSIPGEDYLVQVAGTNNSGDFFFNVSGNYSGETALLEVVGADKNSYEIQLLQTREPDHCKLDFNKFPDFDTFFCLTL